MSRQNPNVLDEMFTPPAGHDLSGNEGSGRQYGGAIGSRETNHGSWKLNDYSSSPRIWSSSQNSYLHRVLKRRSQSNSPRSLVQSATRNSPGRLLKYGIGRSPVTVRLAGLKEENRSVEVRTNSREERADPCDKDVVLSALRQRR